jgi:hypothetical protein
MSTHYPEAEAQKQVLTMYGFGLPGMGFYHIQVLEKRVQKGSSEFSGGDVYKGGGC